jgi:hypothetical protein
MSYGLEIWDNTGMKILSVTSRLSRFHSSYIVTRATESITIVDVSVPGMRRDDTWGVFSVGPNYIFCGSDTCPPPEHPDGHYRMNPVWLPANQLYTDYFRLTTRELYMIGTSFTVLFAVVRI